MTQYNVYIYREMRLKFDGIEADTHEAAAALACEKPTSEADEIDDCEGETLSALVDVDGDEQYEDSRMIDFEQERQRKAAFRLLTSLQAILPYAECEAYALEKLKDSEAAEAEAERAWQAVESAQAIVAEVTTTGIIPAADDTVEA